MKLHHNKQEFQQAIELTAQELNIRPEFVEKDYWMCQILQTLSRHPLCGRIVWKGGTSLSKAYGLIKRFSSDVDFAVLLEGLSQNQQKNSLPKSVTTPRQICQNLICPTRPLRTIDTEKHFMVTNQ